MANKLGLFNDVICCFDDVWADMEYAIHFYKNKQTKKKATRCVMEIIIIGVHTLNQMSNSQTLTD